MYVILNLGRLLRDLTMTSEALRELGGAIAAFVKSDHVKGHTLVSVSHSLGSAAM